MSCLPTRTYLPAVSCLVGKSFVGFAVYGPACLSAYPRADPGATILGQEARVYRVPNRPFALRHRLCVCSQNMVLGDKLHKLCDDFFGLCIVQCFGCRPPLKQALRTIRHLDATSTMETRHGHQTIMAILSGP